MDAGVLEKYGAGPELVQALKKTGYKKLYPPQGMALEAGLLTGRDSFVVSAPTASGKTLIAEMASLQSFFEGRGAKTLYLVPLRALAGEKYEDFSRKYSPLGMKVAMSVGDYDSPGLRLRDADLIIATNEKLDSLIRHRAPWLDEVALVVADEIHLLGDPRRGPVLEVVLTRLRAMRPAPRVIALSATIPNAPELARWLGATLIRSDWRPVPLREGVFYNGAGIFNDGTVTWVAPETGVDALDMALETIKGGGQALVFVNTRKATEALARRSAPVLDKTLSKKERESLKGLSEKVLGATPEPTRLCRRLAEDVRGGAAFHHAGVSHAQRKLVEDAFRERRLKLVSATTTLAMGLNLPSRRVIIRDWWRYEAGAGMQPIPVIEIKQMSGRAGRPGYDSYGEALLVARSRRDEKFLFDNYVKGEPEDVESRLGSPSVLRTHVLALIAGLFARTEKELDDFLARTFFAFAARKGGRLLASIAREAVGFLVKEEMVARRKEVLSATAFGRRVSELYIDPLTGVMLRDSLCMVKEKKELPLFHMVSRTPDMMTLALRKRDREEMASLFYGHREEFLVPEEEVFPTDDFLSALKGAAVLSDWVSEEKEDAIVGRFAIGPGDLRALVELSDWLLYSSGEVARVFGLRDAQARVSTLRVRARYGVKEELLPLVSLRGIGRVRARNLFNAGFKSLESIRGAAAEELSRVPAVGKAVATDIKRQVEGKAPVPTPMD